MIVQTGTYLFVRKSRLLYGDNDVLGHTSSYLLVQVYRIPDEIAEQIAPDHFTRVLSNPEYWREIGYQEWYKTLLLSETIKLVVQMQVGDIDIIDFIECGIEIGYSERMYHSQVGMFAIPYLYQPQLARLH